MATQTNPGVKVAPIIPPGAALDLHALLGVPVLLARQVAAITPRGEVVAAIEHLADLLATLDDADRVFVAPMLAELASLDVDPDLLYEERLDRVRRDENISSKGW